MLCMMKATAIFASSLLLCITGSCSRGRHAANTQTSSSYTQNQSTAAQLIPEESQEKSCKKFVQTFYDGYIHDCWSDGPTDPCSGVAARRPLKYRASVFGPELTRRLNDDAAAQEKAHELVGLDFDFIVNGQDINGRFEVRTVTRKGDRYFADVYEIPEGENPAKPHVVPELTLAGQQWVFVNFHYPDSPYPEDENLISILRGLREDRQHPRK